MHRSQLGIVAARRTMLAPLAQGARSCRDLYIVRGRSVCRNGVREFDARSRDSVVSGASSRASVFAFIARSQDSAVGTMSRRAAGRDGRLSGISVFGLAYDWRPLRTPSSESKPTRRGYWLKSCLARTYRHGRGPSSRAGPRISKPQVKRETLTMHQGSCHCGAVRLRLPSTPEVATDCNCSLCRRIGDWRPLGVLRVRNGEDRRPSRLDRGLRPERQNSAHDPLQALRLRHSLGAA